MNDRSATLRAVVRGNLCSGCGLCAGVSDGAVTMQESGEGYLRPVQTGPLSDFSEELIAHSCPGLSVKAWPESSERLEVHPIWGPARATCTGYATDEELRFVGSSGGVLSALAKLAIEEQLVDAVLSIRAGDENEPFANPQVLIEDPDSVAASAGSRYSPSSPISKIDDLLEDSRRFLIIGKPCDISALRRLGERDPRVAQRFPFMLSFFCGGIPSRKGSADVVQALGFEPEDVTAFRYRGHGWPGKARAQARDGRAAEMDYETSWGQYLARRVQFRCKICPDAVGGVADIACADAWFGGETGYPQFEDRAGRSLIMVRSAAGEKLLALAVDRKAIATEAASYHDIDLMQPSQRKRKSFVAARTSALVATMRPVPRFRGVKVIEAARTAQIRDHVRNFLGTTVRIVRGRT